MEKEIKEAIAALKEVCVQEENKQKLAKINNALQQRCIDFKDNQKKMISSLTNNFRTSIKIDRIMFSENLTNQDGQTLSHKHISIQFSIIKQQVESYYTQ